MQRMVHAVPPVTRARTLDDADSAFESRASRGSRGEMSRGERSALSRGSKGSAFALPRRQQQQQQQQHHFGMHAHEDQQSVHSKSSIDYSRGSRGSRNSRGQIAPRGPGVATQGRFPGGGQFGVQGPPQGRFGAGGPPHAINGGGPLSHADMLQAFLKTQAGGEQVASETAKAFDEFLKFQHRQHLQQQQQQMQHHQENSLQLHLNPQAPSSGGVVEVDEDGTFVPDQSWDDGTFVEYEPRMSYSPPQSEVSSIASSMTGGLGGLGGLGGMRSATPRDGDTINSSGTNFRRSRDLVAKTREMTSKRSVFSEDDHLASMPKPPSTVRGRPGTQYGAPLRPQPEEGPAHHMAAHHQYQQQQQQPNHHAAAAPMVGQPNHGGRAGMPVHQKPPERSLKDQLMALTPAQRGCVSTLRASAKEPFPEPYYLRFAWCSPGSPFDTKSAQKVMKKFDRRYLGLRIGNFERFLGRRVIYPVPGLRTRKGQDGKCM